MAKFRTMYQDAERDGPQWSPEGDPRTTRVGRFLRRTRLDEFPNVWSVIKGDMSLVGPRPERPAFVAMLERELPLYRARLAVAPGLTGWAQVNHKYTDSVDDALVKLEFDLYYVKHRSIAFDLGILARTVRTMFRLRGR
jgi:lipopolysaccharide/colanic/teichoic acid biosynthesis glycosyltransferase